MRDVNSIDDTIAAIATPSGEGGIAIIRISGVKALAVADAVFTTRAGKPSSFASHTIHLGTIQRDGHFLDQVLLSVMRAPRTYTTEDIVEINCHGGILTARMILDLCLRQGARLAEPGEFTKRAFLNGRMDLTQAEAVMDLISAKTGRAQATAANAMEGHLSRRVEQIRERLITVLAHIEAQIDFPDEDITPSQYVRLESDVAEILCDLRRLLATANEGKILREGISIAIIGRPNSGKSSLMNLLLGQERSIVTAIPGTTRDTIDEYTNIRGLPIRLTDTAGIRDPRGKVEKIGVSRSHKILIDSAIRLHVMDSSKPFTVGDLKMMELCNSRSTIVVENKIDLKRRLSIPNSPKKLVSISCKTGAGLDFLVNAIESEALKNITNDLHNEIAINERHKNSLRRADVLLRRGQTEMTTHAPLEVVAQSYRGGLEAIGDVVGNTTTDDILEKIFSTFCIGK